MRDFWRLRKWMKGKMKLEISFYVYIKYINGWTSKQRDSLMNFNSLTTLLGKWGGVVLRVFSTSHQTSFENTCWKVNWKKNLYFNFGFDLLWSAWDGFFLRAMEIAQLFSNDLGGLDPGLEPGKSFIVLDFIELVLLNTFNQETG